MTEGDIARIDAPVGDEDGEHTEAEDEVVDSMDVGETVDQVFVEIDYAILQHFSQHLYSSPNKAVEELVTNGYDALAERVDVFLPGRFAADCLLVWDSGTSMDIDALKHLWWIARSPKAQQGGERLAVSADGKTQRKMVGKFGIGKLASYAVGDRLSHLCRLDNKYLLVSVDYNQAPQLTDSTEPGDRGFSTPIRELGKTEAEALVRAHLREEPADLDALLARSTWTLAIIDSLREDVNLTEGRLTWVLGNGMPIRPDFAVHVNGQQVAPSKLATGLTDWNMSTDDIQRYVTAEWVKAQTEGTVDGVPEYGHDGGANVVGGGDDPEDAELLAAKQHWVDLPELGKVRARIRLFDESLREGRSADHGRSEGFFVYVKGRLLNPDDAKLLLPDPSFGTFNRMQVILWADGLDADLLADRERLSRTMTTAAPLQVLQHALYLAGRSFLDKHDDKKSDESSPITILPSESREFFRQPLIALALRKQADGEPGLDMRKLKIEQSPAPDTQPLMSVETGSSSLVLNTGHPLYLAVRNRVGDTKKGREALRLVELMGISDLLLEGTLIDFGVEDEMVDRIVRWRTGQLRGLAVRYASSPDQVVAEAIDASYAGQARFEKALAQLFRLMGFVAERDGDSGQKDVLLVAPLGEEGFSFTVEAKGSKNAVENDAAEISGAAAHAAKVGARFALVVAREFKGFTMNPDADAAILQECRAQGTPVTIATVETLALLFDALHRNHYPLRSLVEVLQPVEPPAKKLAAVQALIRPTEKFDVADLLKRCWELQQGKYSGNPVPLLDLRTSRDDWKALGKDEFDRVIFAIDALSGGLLSFQGETYSVVMQQSPEVIASAIATSVGEDEGEDGNSTEITP